MNFVNHHYPTPPLPCCSTPRQLHEHVAMMFALHLRFKQERLWRWRPRQRLAFIPSQLVPLNASHKSFAVLRVMLSAPNAPQAAACVSGMQLLSHFISPPQRECILEVACCAAAAFHSGRYRMLWVPSACTPFLYRGAGQPAASSRRTADDLCMSAVWNSWLQQSAAVLSAEPNEADAGICGELAVACAPQPDQPVSQLMSRRGSGSVMAPAGLIDGLRRQHAPLYKASFWGERPVSISCRTRLLGIYTVCQLMLHNCKAHGSLFGACSQPRHTSMQRGAPDSHAALPSIS